MVYISVIITHILQITVLHDIDPIGMVRVNPCPPSGLAFTLAKIHTTTAREPSINLILRNMLCKKSYFASKNILFNEPISGNKVGKKAANSYLALILPLWTLFLD